MNRQAKYCHYSAGVWCQFWAQRTGCGFVLKTHHFTLAAAERAARKYARQAETPTSVDLSRCGGICDGDTVRWINGKGEEISREARR
jgi:hypothetical protein